MRSTGPVQNILSKRSSPWVLESRTGDEIAFDAWKEEACAVFSDTYGVVLTGWLNDGASDECAHEAGLTPQEFAYQQGDTYGLTPRKGYLPEVKKALKAAKKAAKHYAAVTAAILSGDEDNGAMWLAICQEGEATQDQQCEDYSGDFDREYEALGRRQEEAADAYHSYQKWLNDPKDEYGNRLSDLL